MTVLSGLAWLLVVVTFGAIVPVVPTGAAVSAAAVLGLHQHPVVVALVIATGAAGAYVGDAVMYAVCRWGGEHLARRLRWLRDTQRVTAVMDRLRHREVSVLLVSRLVPGGRVPVLLAAGLTGLPWRRFLLANLPACVLWALVYATIGVLGGAVFPQPWQGVVAALALVLVGSQIASLVSRLRDARTTRSADPARSGPP